MKKYSLLIFLSAIFFGFTLMSCNNSNPNNSANGCDSLCKNYDMVLNKNGIIVLKRKVEDTVALSTTTTFAYTAFPNGKIIDTATARKEINDYRSKFKGETQYVDFGFLELLEYFTKLKTPYPDANSHIGMRIYPSLDGSGKLTIIFAPTYDGKAIWRQKNGGTSSSTRATTNDTDPFNTGSICPPNCPDGDE